MNLTNFKSKKALFYLILILLTYGFVELVSFAAYFSKYGELYSYAKIESQRGYSTNAESQINKSQKVGYAMRGGIGTRVVHPYLGFVFNPGKPIKNLDVKQFFTDEECKVNDQGYAGDTFLKRSKDSVNVIIVGGSVANQFFCLSQDKLKSLLKQSPKFKNKEINIIGMGIGAHKQPQQLMAINYYLAHGGEFDILINIDGFNESHNTNYMYELGVYPSYPFKWNEHVATSSPESLKIISRVVHYQNIKRDLAKFNEKTNFSVTLNVVWSFLDSHVNRRMDQKLNKLNGALRDSSRQFYAVGPKDDNIDIDEFTTRLWSNSSIQLGKLAKANDAKYYHFLQPNIHYSGAKPLSAAELSLIEDLPKHIKPSFVNNLYVDFNKEARKFKKGEVKYFDLTYLFKNNEETIYVDRCCHFNKTGNDIMAKTVADKIKLLN